MKTNQSFEVLYDPIIFHECGTSVISVLCMRAIVFFNVYPTATKKEIKRERIAIQSNTRHKSIMMKTPLNGSKRYVKNSIEFESQAVMQEEKESEEQKIVVLLLKKTH
eukprot:472775_1